jgi:drug/metabolite transporter (DMT)-like permease
MKPRDLLELLSLAAIWGASFLFMRVAVPGFGPVALAGLRVAGASLLLMPLLVMRGEWPHLRRHWRPILLVGLTNSALPFLCYAYAALAITGGLSSVFNATSPLWGALIAWLWLHERPTLLRTVGLVIGFGGVAWLAWDKAHFKAGADGINSGLAVLACLCATLMYGFSANYTRRFLSGVPALTLAAGSQFAAALLLAVPMLWRWPTQNPGVSAWGAAAGLALACTGIAYVMYFRLIARLGATRAISVTFLVPAFAVLWGALFIHEDISATMLVACGVILAGTALVTGRVGARSTAAAS